MNIPVAMIMIIPLENDHEHDPISSGMFMNIPVAMIMNMALENDHDHVHEHCHDHEHGT